MGRTRGSKVTAILILVAAVIAGVWIAYAIGWFLWQVVKAMSR